MSNICLHQSTTKFQFISLVKLLFRGGARYKKLVGPLYVGVVKFGLSRSKPYDFINSHVKNWGGRWPPQPPSSAAPAVKA